MTEQTSAEKLAARFAALKYDGVSVSSRHAVKRLLLDYLGVAAAGSRTGSGRIARRFAAEQGGKPQARLIGDSARVPMANAAFANAISSHSIELDDIDALALFHFSPPVYSSALAVAEGVGASGKALVAALAAGCEMMERASTATNPSLRNRGFTPRRPAACSARRWPPASCCVFRPTVSLRRWGSPAPRPRD